MIIAGCNSRIAEAFVQHKNFWLNTAPPQNLEIDGFVLHPDEVAPDQNRHFERISPTTLIHDGGERTVYQRRLALSLSARHANTRSDNTIDGNSRSRGAGNGVLVST